MIAAGFWGARVAYRSHGITLTGLVTDQGPTNGTVKVEWETDDGVRGAYLPVSILRITSRPYSHRRPSKSA